MAATINGTEPLLDATGGADAKLSAAGPGTAPGADDDAFLAPFLADDFDPVAYARELLGSPDDGEGYSADSDADADTGAGPSSPKDKASDDEVELRLARLAFTSSDLTRQIEQLVIDHFDELARSVDGYLAAGHRVAGVQAELEALAKDAQAWRASVAEPRDELRAVLAATRAHRDLASLARALEAYLAASEILPAVELISSPTTVPDADLPALAASVAALHVLAAESDLAGVDAFDAAHAKATAARSALLARCNGMIHPRDPPRARTALAGLAALGVLGEWHVLRRAKVASRIDNEAREFLEALASAEHRHAQLQQAAAAASGGGVSASGSRGDLRSAGQQRRDSNPAAAAAWTRLETCLDVVATEAKFLRVLLGFHPVDGAWDEFWAGVTTTLAKLFTAPAATRSNILGANYPRIVRLLRATESRFSDAGDLNLASAAAPLAAPYLARVESAITDAVNLAFPARNPGTAPSSPHYAQLGATLASHLSAARESGLLDPTARLVAAALDTLRLRSAAHVADTLAVAGVPSSAPTATPAQAAVAASASAVYAAYDAVASTVDESDPALAPVVAALDAVHATAAALADALMQAGVAAADAAILSPRTAGDWAGELGVRLKATRDVVARLHCGADGDAWRRVLVETLAEHVAASLAVVVGTQIVKGGSGAKVRWVNELAGIEALLASLLPTSDAEESGLWTLPAFRHIESLRGAVLVDWPAPGAAGSDDARASFRASPVVAAVVLAGIAARGTPLWKQRRETPRETLDFVLDMIDLAQDGGELPREVAEWVRGVGGGAGEWLDAVQGE
ncbi:hypothetical protein H9P43_000250 [Blastocladiella emersonii ATCC 22665]|nr:hypothetical protein H9P43_000250 [Blastocladiella emersonii ATCC 22665]